MSWDRQAALWRAGLGPDPGPPPTAHIDSGVIRLTMAALREVGLSSSDEDARSIILALRKHGVMVTYEANIEQLGEIAHVCVHSELGRLCSYCRCPRKRGDA
jgi:hypothetical protein